MLRRDQWTITGSSEQPIGQRREITEQVYIYIIYILIYIYNLHGEIFFTFIRLIATSVMQKTPQLNISKVATVIFGNLNLMVHLWWWLFIHAAGETHIFEYQRSFLMFLHKNIIISNLWPMCLETPFCRRRSTLLPWQQAATVSFPMSSLSWITQQLLIFAVSQISAEPCSKTRAVWNKSVKYL